MAGDNGPGYQIGAGTAAIYNKFAQLWQASVVARYGSESSTPASVSGLGVQEPFDTTPDSTTDARTQTFARVGPGPAQPMPRPEGGGDRDGAVWPKRKTLLSDERVVEVCYYAGFRGRALLTAIAIAKAESQFYADSWSEGSFEPWKEDRLGVKAMGLFQVVPTIADSGFSFSFERGGFSIGGYTQNPSDYKVVIVESGLTGGTTRGGIDGRYVSIPKLGMRNIHMLFNEQFNAIAAFTISKRGTNFSPWDTYNHGAYKKYLGLASDLVNRYSYADLGTGVDGVPIEGTKPIPDPAWLTGKLTAVHLGANARSGELTTRLINGTIDLSTKQASQVTMEFDDPGHRLVTNERLQIGMRFQVNKDRFTVTEVQPTSKDGSHTTAVTAMASGTVALMHTEAGTITGYPSEIVQVFAKAVGLPITSTGFGFNDETPGTASRWTFTPTTSDQSEMTEPLDALMAINPYITRETNRSRNQSAWDAISQLTRNSGYECYEVEGRLYFGPSSKTALTAGAILRVKWPGMPGAVDEPAVRALDIPEITLSGAPRAKFGKVTASFSLPPEYRTYVKLGQGVDLGISSWLAATVPSPFYGTVPQILHVVRINWDLADLTSPIKVDVESAMDDLGTDSPGAKDDADATDPQSPNYGRGAVDPYAPKTGVGKTVVLPSDGFPANKVSPEQAVRAALAKIGTSCPVNHCMNEIGRLFGHPTSGWADPDEMWPKTPDRWKYDADTATGANPPAGMVVIWAGGAHGHIAISVGGGDCVSTDFPHGGVWGRVPIAGLTQKWNKRFRGAALPYFPRGG